MMTGKNKHTSPRPNHTSCALILHKPGIRLEHKHVSITKRVFSSFFLRKWSAFVACFFSWTVSLWASKLRKKEGSKEARQPCPLFIIKTNGVAPHDKTAKTQLERDNKRSISTPMYAHHLTLSFCLRSKSSRCHFYKNSFSCHVNTAIHCLRLCTR